MKLLYEAANAVEAHMILNLLEQSGLRGRIDGEYLQGGVGELQATGFVRVMIDENDYIEGRSIVEAWDTKQPVQEIVQPAKPGKRIGAVVVSFLFGMLVMVVYYHTPITEEGIDYDGDGKLDEQWTYVNYRPSKVTFDRNRDGEIDEVINFDRQGLIESGLLDQDFNGTFDSEIYYDYGNIIWKKSDTNGDGFKNYREDYTFGIRSKGSFSDPKTKKLVKVQEFDSFLLVRTEVDTTGDGVLDTIYEYNDIEEIAPR